MSVDSASIRFVEIAWLAWLAVWIGMATSVKPTTVRESLWARAGHIAPLLVSGVLFLGIPADAPPWIHLAVARRHAWMWPAGACAVGLGLSFAIWARLVLAGNWSGIVTIKQDHELVRRGPYRIVRHPIYTGLLTALFGTALGIDEWRAFLAFAIITISFILKMRREEVFMVEQFGSGYQRYARGVAGLLPWIW